MQVIRGDSAEVLRDFENNSIDAVVTDPPHGLFFMGSSWDADLPEQAIWDECFRVMKPGGHMFVMSSERLGCVAGLYMSLRKAGFEVDETQILNWVSLTGMPKSVDVGKVADKQAFRDWLDHVGADLTNAERRKAASAAVNGEYCNPAGTSEGRGVTYSASGTLGNAVGSGDTALLSRLLASHWPDSPSERREHWEAVVAEVPEDWDCSAPPGVRVKVGEDQWADLRKNFGYDAAGKRDGGDTWGDETRNFNETAPSTPDACALEGRRASVAPLKPFAYPILHACKPREGSYLANWRKWGTGPMGVGDARIPFGATDGEDGDERGRAGYWPGARSGRGDYAAPGWCATEGGKRSDAGRTPSNLLSYGDLLGDLQRYCDLDAWCDALGLPEEAAELLEAGLVYAPKPSRAEKEAGLDEFEEVLLQRAATNTPRCATCGKWIQTSKAHTRPNSTCTCAKPVPGELPKRKPTRNTHPTAKPAALCAYLCVLASAPGQTVLDPFCGSGSTGVAAALTGRDFIGIELDPENKGFAEIARARIAHAEQTVANREPLAADCAERTDDTCADVSAQPALMEVCAE